MHFMSYSGSVLGNHIIGIPVVGVCVIVAPIHIIEVDRLNNLSVVCLCINLCGGLCGNSLNSGSVYGDLTDNDVCTQFLCASGNGNGNVLCLSLSKCDLMTDSEIAFHGSGSISSIALGGEVCALVGSVSTHIGEFALKSPVNTILTYVDVVCVVHGPISGGIAPGSCACVIRTVRSQPDGYIVKLTLCVELEHRITEVFLATEGGVRRRYGIGIEVWIDRILIS